MANTTSNTTTFDKTFSVDEIIEEAFERLGIQDVTGYHLKSSRRSLNIMFQEWGNRGLHYWEVGELDLDLLKVKQNINFLDLLQMVQMLFQLLLMFMEYQMSLRHS